MTSTACVTNYFIGTVSQSDVWEVPDYRLLEKYRFTQMCKLWGVYPKYDDEKFPCQPQRFLQNEFLSGNCVALNRLHCDCCLVHFQLCAAAAAASAASPLSQSSHWIRAPKGSSSCLFSLLCQFILIMSAMGKIHKSKSICSHVSMSLNFRLF